ncbi:MAG: hypothetical protein Q9186_007512 [Xanthomendoza sp. 1 TL-2023]
MKGKPFTHTRLCISNCNPAILQRVASASVTVDTQLISSIGKGVLVFAAVASDDTPKEVESMAAKVLKMKMWPDDAGGTRGGPMQYASMRKIPYSSASDDELILLVSQFTLLASTKKGSKPDFHGAAGGEQARELYDHFVKNVQELYEKDKVTLEIQTNPSSTQAKGNAGTNADAKGEKKGEYQLPAELLE